MEKTSPSRDFVKCEDCFYRFTARMENLLPICPKCGGLALRDRAWEVDYLEQLANNGQQTC